MKIKDFKKAILDNYQANEEREVGDFWSAEIEKGLDEILNYAENTELSKKEIAKDLDIELSELADGMVEPYTIGLLKWYLEDINRCGYVDEFMSEFGTENDFIKLLSGGQYVYYSQLLNCVRDLAEKEVEKI